MNTNIITREVSKLACKLSNDILAQYDKRSTECIKEACIELQKLLGIPVATAYLIPNILTYSQYIPKGAVSYPCFAISAKCGTIYYICYSYNDELYYNTLLTANDSNAHIVGCFNNTMKNVSFGN